MFVQGSVEVALDPSELDLDTATIAARSVLKKDDIVHIIKDTLKED